MNKCIIYNINYSIKESEPIIIDTSIEAEPGIVDRGGSDVMKLITPVVLALALAGSGKQVDMNADAFANKALVSSLESNVLSGDHNHTGQIAVRAAVSSPQSSKSKKSKSPKWVPTKTRKKRNFGVAVSNEYMDDQGYLDHISQSFDSVVAENAAKKDALEPIDGMPLRFGKFDSIVQTAKRNGQYIRGHALNFGGQDPGWVKRYGERCKKGILFDKSDAIKKINNDMQSYTTEVMRRYAKDVNEWDVVNEPLNSKGALQENSWRKCQPDYIERLYMIARTADPSAKLILNENNVEFSGPKRDAFVELARDLHAKGLLDGVGLQTHLNIYEQRVPEMADTIKIFSDIGLEVIITEMDVALPKNPKPADLQKQTNIYIDTTKICIRMPACSGMYFWGASDEESWIENNATLFEKYKSSYHPKKAYSFIKRYLR